MSYNLGLEKSLDQILLKNRNFFKKKMFGGLAYFFNGNVVCGIYHDELILRLSHDHAEQMLSIIGIRAFDVTGRKMKGWVMVSPEALNSVMSLKEFTRMSIDFVKLLPPK